MADSSKPTRVASIGEPGPSQQQISSALAAQPEFQLVDLISPAVDNLVKELRAVEPHIILVDQPSLGQIDLDLLDELVEKFPEAAVVAILPSSDPVLAQQVMLAGASGFLIQPFTQINLLSTLRRVHDLQMRRIKSQTVTASQKAEAARLLRTIALFSPRGGVGVTSLAANLALALYEETAAKVLLVEGKLFFGHLGVLLNIRSRNSFADLIPHASNLDEVLIREVIHEHATGLHVLLAPTDVQLAQGIRAQDVYNVLISLERLYDFLVIDAGSSLNEDTITFLDAADRIFLLAVPELASLHDASRFLQLSHSLGYSAEKIQVLLNQVGRPGGVKQGDVEAALHQPLAAQIPYDQDAFIRSINRGVPLLLRYPRSPASRAIRKLAKQLAQSMTAAAPVPGH
jgi:pilus assembly protein CpaE